MAIGKNSEFESAHRLKREERKEIGLLVNAGVPYKALTEEYDVSMDTVHAISSQRPRWLRPAEIVLKEDEKFLYAQRLYGAHQSSDAIKSRIERYVFQPLAEQIAKQLVVPSPQHALVYELRGTNPRNEPAYRARLVAYALDVLKEDALHGRTHMTIDDALTQGRRTTLDLEHLHYSDEQWRERKFIDETFPELLNRLTATERDIVCRLYGIGRPAESLPAIGKSYGHTKQWAWNLKESALETLQQKVARAFASLSPILAKTQIPTSAS